MTAHQEYKRQVREAQRRYKKELLILKAELRQKQLECDHKFVFRKNLLYVLGEVYDGFECNKCGEQRSQRNESESECF